MSAAADLEVLQNSFQGFEFDVFGGKTTDINAIRIAIETASQLGKNVSGDRHYKRAEVRRRLEEIAKTEKQVESIKAVVVKWEQELSAAVAAHQKAARPIQMQLADENLDGERLIQLRLDLGVLNDELQKSADSLNKKIGAANQELAQLFAITCAKDQLQNALLRTGNPLKLRRLAVVQNSVRWAQQRATTASKRLAEAEAELAEGTKPFLARFWDRFGEQTQPAQRMAADAQAKVTEEIELLKLESDTAAKILGGFQREAATLEAEIVAE